MRALVTCWNPVIVHLSEFFFNSVLNITSAEISYFSDLVRNVIFLNTSDIILHVVNISAVTGNAKKLV